VGPVPAPVAWTAAAMSAKSSSFRSRVAAGSCGPPGGVPHREDDAAVGNSGSGLPSGLGVLRPDRSFGPNGPGSSPAAERAVIPAGGDPGRAPYLPLSWAAAATGCHSRQVASRDS
jgi:hypothetical protein